VVQRGACASPARCPSSPYSLKALTQSSASPAGGSSREKPAACGRSTKGASVDKRIAVQILASLATLEGVCAGLPGVMWQRMACLFIGMLLALYAGKVAGNGAPRS